MVVGIAVVELHIPAARGLKEKRKVVKSLTERLAKRYRISIAETGYHDLHQRTQLGLALVGRDSKQVRELLVEIRRRVDGLDDAFLTRWDEDLVVGAE